MSPAAHLQDLALRTTQILVDHPGEVTVEVDHRADKRDVLVVILVDPSDLEKASTLRVGLLATLEGAAGCFVELRIETRGSLDIPVVDMSTGKTIGHVDNRTGEATWVDDDLTPDDCPEMQDTGCDLGTACACVDGTAPDPRPSVAFLVHSFDGLTAG